MSWAAQNGHEAVVQLLTERPCVVTVLKNKNGWTPLLLAACNGHEAVVRLLVERDDVDADSKGNDGWTPLSLAAYRGHEAVARLLVERDECGIGRPIDRYYSYKPMQLGMHRQDIGKMPLSVGTFL